jgi:hypothetical protein
MIAHFCAKLNKANAFPFLTVFGGFGYLVATAVLRTNVRIA